WDSEPYTARPRINGCAWTARGTRIWPAEDIYWLRATQPPYPRSFPELYFGRTDFSMPAPSHPPGPPLNQQKSGSKGEIAAPFLKGRIPRAYGGGLNLLGDPVIGCDCNVAASGGPTLDNLNAT